MGFWRNPKCHWYRQTLLIEIHLWGWVLWWGITINQLKWWKINRMPQWVWWERDSEHHQDFLVWSGEGRTGFLWRGWSRVRKRVRELEKKAQKSILNKQDTGFENVPTEIYFGTAGCQQVYEGYGTSLSWGVFKTKLHITLAWNKRNGIGNFWKSCATSVILVRAQAAVAGERKPWGKGEAYLYK